jgi:protoheme IX farnesyltransferase
MSTTSLAMGRDQATWLSRIADYVELSKPRIAVLVLVVVAVAYHVARWGQPEPWVLVHLLLGTLLVAASASGANQFLERHSDSLMERTAERPIASGRIGVSEALVFVSATLVIGAGYLFVAVGWQPAIWAFLTWLVYVAVYTPLKSRTWLNTAVGAVGGALPILIGWSAGGGYDLRAGGLFVLLFLWQFPHFMAIAWLYRKQYARAGMKMLPVVDPSGRHAGVQAVVAALALIPVSLIPMLNVPGWSIGLLAIAAILLGVGQLFCAVAFFRHQHDRSARQLLRASLIYLPLVLLLMLLVPWL